MTAATGGARGSDATWPACRIPELPPARGFESSGTTELQGRYEDVAQDGRVHLTALISGLAAVWHEFGTGDALVAFRAQGVLPILRRVVITGEEGPFSFHTPIQVSGTWRLAREKDGDRIFLNMWLDAHAPIGFTLAPPPPADAARVLVGQVFAEYVMSKPFAPPEGRRVTRLDAPGLPAIPEDEYSFEEAEKLVAGHELEAARERVFGLVHTDSNQHVNSLVYPRLFEEAVVERMIDGTAFERPATLLARALEVQYRKPFFTGERAAIAVRAEPVVGDPAFRAVAVGTFAPAGGAAKPSCAIAMWLG